MNTQAHGLADLLKGLTKGFNPPRGPIRLHRSACAAPSVEPMRERVRNRLQKVACAAPEQMAALEASPSVRAPIGAWSKRMVSP